MKDDYWHRPFGFQIPCIRHVEMKVSRERKLTFCCNAFKIAESGVGKGYLCSTKSKEDISLPPFFVDCVATDD